MYKPVKDFLSEIKVGARQSHHNMTLYCLLSAREAAVDFLTMDEALAQDLLDVTEVTEGGSVPELRVRNRGDHKVLMLDGEELVGAKTESCIECDDSFGAAIRYDHSGILRGTRSVVLSESKVRERSPGHERVSPEEEGGDGNQEFAPRGALSIRPGSGVGRDTEQI